MDFLKTTIKGFLFLLLAIAFTLGCGFLSCMIGNLFGCMLKICISSCIFFGLLVDLILLVSLAIGKWINND